MSVRLGYACINTELQKHNITTSRTLRLDTINKQGIKAAKDLALHNISDLEKIIMSNERRGIRFFRVTSGLFPHMENPQILTLAEEGKYTVDFAKAELALVGGTIRKLGHRVTAHPSQFCQLGSPRPEVVLQTVADLTMHADIFHHMGLTPAMGSVLILHGGGKFEGKRETLQRWRENFLRLPQHVRDYISAENDDYIYSLLDLLPMCEELNIPIVIDFFHHQCYGAPGTGAEPEFDIYDPGLIERVMAIWRRRGIKPKCHLSDQMKDARKGSHDDYIEEIPAKLIDVAVKYSMDIMCECKMKDQCVQKLLDKHFDKHVEIIKMPDGGAQEYTWWQLKQKNL